MNEYGDAKSDTGESEQDPETRGEARTSSSPLSLEVPRNEAEASSEASFPIPQAAMGLVVFIGVGWGSGGVTDDPHSEAEGIFGPLGEFFTRMFGWGGKLDDKHDQDRINDGKAANDPALDFMRPANSGLPPERRLRSDDPNRALRSRVDSQRFQEDILASASAAAAALPVLLEAALMLGPGPEEAIAKALMEKHGLEITKVAGKSVLRKGGNVLKEEEALLIKKEFEGLRKNPDSAEAKKLLDQFGNNTAPKNVPSVNFTKEMLANSEVIERGSRIRKIDKLVEAFGGTKQGWIKKKGWDASGKEWHWYEHHGIGRKGVKPAGEVDPF